MAAPPIASIPWRAEWLLPALVAMVLVAVACRGNPGPEARVNVEKASTYGQPELLVDVNWLEENLGRDDLIVLDVRQPAMYAQGHIPGAVNLNPLDLNTNDLVRGVVGPLERVERVLEGLGVSDDVQVVIYDGNQGMWAARALWVLEYYGNTSVSLLNGGFASWQKEGFEVATDVPKRPPGTLPLAPMEERRATKEYVLAALDQPGVVLLDVRTAREYSGEAVLSTPGSPSRGGHVPGAMNVPWEAALTESDVQAFKSQRELEKVYLAAGVSPDKEIIVYCQTGVRAAHTYFTLRLMGYENVRLYDGSWEEWGSDPALPLEKS